MNFADLTWGVHPNDARWRHATGTLPNGTHYSVVEDAYNAPPEYRAERRIYNFASRPSLDDEDGTSFRTPAEIDALLTRAVETQP